MKRSENMDRVKRPMKPSGKFSKWYEHSGRNFRITINEYIKIATWLDANCILKPKGNRK